jgi:hypothetical protein
LKCPCQPENPRKHGDRCHYEGIISTACSGPATTIMHDRRLCVTVCATHYRWRMGLSRALGHSRTCPDASASS